MNIQEASQNGEAFLLPSTSKSPDFEEQNSQRYLPTKTNLLQYKNGTDKPLDYAGITLKLSEIYFIPLENPNKPTDLGIKVLFKNYILHKYNPKLKEIVHLIVEHLIGEKSFANDIAFIEIE